MPIAYTILMQTFKLLDGTRATVDCFGFVRAGGMGFDYTALTGENRRRATDATLRAIAARPAQIR